MLKQLLIPGLLICIIGCGQGSNIREYEVDREDEKILTSDVLRDQFESVPFRWNVPADWKVGQNDQFSAFAWTIGSGDDAARVTVSELPGTAGIEPQFVRWRDQLMMPKIDLADVMSTVKTLSMKGLTGQYIEIRGESESILGMIVRHKEKLWVFKYRSANSTADLNRKAFRRFCESLSTE